MQESTFILTIFLAAVGVGAAFIAFRLFRGRWQRKERQMISREEVLVSSPSPSESSSDPEHVLTAQESGSVAEEVGNEQREFPVDTIQSPSDSTDSTLAELQAESKKEETETIKVDNLIESEGSIRDIVLYDAIEGTSDILPVTDGATVLKETPYEDSALIEHKQNVAPNQLETIDDIERDVPPNSSNKLSPEKRGGARRGQRKTDTREAASEKSQRTRKPEVVCWQQSRKWFLGIEIPDEYADTSQLAVSQGSNTLRSETNLRRLLASVDGNITISSQLSSESFELTLAEKESPFLLFKLSGRNLTQGRRILYATSGTYLVVTPENWIRNEELSGIPQVPPAQCHLKGFKAHLFHLDSEADNRIAFLTSEGKSIEVPNRRSEFELVGSLIKDASETMGPLFGLSHPKIRSQGTEGWKNVATVVIGEEGERRGGWKTSFDADKDSDTQDLSLLLSGKQGGWYFVRIYDASEGAPIESFDFRFVTDLKAITISQHDVLPGEDGHKTVRIDLNWSGDTPCELIPNHSKNLTIDTNHTCTSIEIPPDPDCDKTEWTLGLSTGSRVPISLLVERVWWSICNQNISSEYISWKDKPVVVQRNHLVASSDHLLRIRFPRCRWTRKVHVGFEQRRTREYPVEVTKQVVDIPLKEFEGMVELENYGEDHPLKLWINGYTEQTVAVLSSQSKSDRPVRPQRSKGIKLNIKRLLKYLNRLNRFTKDAALADMLNECKTKWRLAGVKEQLDAYSLQTACVIMLCWRVMRGKGIKPIGRRKGWVRKFVKLAEANPTYLKATSKKYEILGSNSANPTE